MKIGGVIVVVFSIALLMLVLNGEISPFLFMASASLLVGRRKTSDRLLANCPNLSHSSYLFLNSRCEVGRQQDDYSDYLPVKIEPYTESFINKGLNAKASFAEAARRFEAVVNFQKDFVQKIIPDLGIPPTLMENFRKNNVTIYLVHPLVADSILRNGRIMSIPLQPQFIAPSILFEKNDQNVGIKQRVSGFYHFRNNSIYLTINPLLGGEFSRNSLGYTETILDGSFEFGQDLIFALRNEVHHAKVYVTNKYKSQQPSPYPYINQLGKLDISMKRRLQGTIDEFRAQIEFLRNNTDEATVALLKLHYKPLIYKMFMSHDEFNKGYERNIVKSSSPWKANKFVNFTSNGEKLVAVFYSHNSERILDIFLHDVKILDRHYSGKEKTYRDEAYLYEYSSHMDSLQPEILSHIAPKWCQYFSEYFNVDTACSCTKTPRALCM